MSKSQRVSQYERFRIQMAVLVPLVRRLRREVGQERADEVVAATLDEIGRKQGEKVVAGGRPVTVEMLVNGMEAFAADGALSYEVVGRGGDGIGFDITRCRYAEYLDEIGARDLGPELVCRGDFPAAEAMGVELTRTETLMTGGRRCNFRYRLRKAAPVPGQ